MRGYKKFAKTGQPLTMADVKRIEIGAMTSLGVPFEYANHAVKKAIAELKRLGINNPTRIPWKTGV